MEEVEGTWLLPPQVLVAKDSGNNALDQSRQIVHNIYRPQLLVAKDSPI